MSNRSKSSTRGNILFSLRVISNNPIRLKRFSNRVLSARGMLPFESFSSQDVFRAFFLSNLIIAIVKHLEIFHITFRLTIWLNFLVFLLFSASYKNNCNLAFEFHLQLAIFLFRFAKKTKNKNSTRVWVYFRLWSPPEHNKLARASVQHGNKTLILNSQVRQFAAPKKKTGKRSNLPLVTTLPRAGDDKSNKVYIHFRLYCPLHNPHSTLCATLQNTLFWRLSLFAKRQNVPRTESQGDKNQAYVEIFIFFFLPVFTST